MITIPHGFRSAPSGLIVPQTGRETQTWTHAEWRVLNRARKLLHSKGVHLLLQCQDPACGSALVPIQERDGSIVLRCDHADRHLMRAY